MKTLVFLILLISTCLAQGTGQWVRTKLLVSGFHIEVPGKLLSSTWSSPGNSNPIFERGQAFFSVFGKVGCYVMDGRKRPNAGFIPRAAAMDLLNGFVRKSQGTLRFVNEYKSSVKNANGILLLAAEKIGKEDVAISIHVSEYHGRIAILRMVWPSQSKEAAATAMRISNSLHK